MRMRRALRARVVARTERGFGEACGRSLQRQLVACVRIVIVHRHRLHFRRSVMYHHCCPHFSNADGRQRAKTVWCVCVVPEMLLNICNGTTPNGSVRDISGGRLDGKFGVGAGDSREMQDGNETPRVQDWVWLRC